MDFLIGIVDHDTNCCAEMSRKQKAYAVQSYFECDSEFMSDMLLELSAPCAGVPAEATSNTFTTLLGAAIAANVLIKLTDEQRVEAYRALGELIAAHAVTHGVEKLDAYIDDNLDSLDDASDEVRAAKAYGY